MLKLLLTVAACVGVYLGFSAVMPAVHHTAFHLPLTGWAISYLFLLCGATAALSMGWVSLKGR